jgi:O-antigen/teichoic acid export membrane protein
VISFVICVTLEFLTPTLIPFFFGNAFRNSVGVTQIMLISAFIVSVRRVLSDGMRGAGYPTLGTYGEVVGLVLLLPLLVVLVPMAGITGAATAMAIAAAGGFCTLLIGIAISGRPRAERRPPTIHAPRVSDPMHRSGRIPATRVVSPGDAGDV